MPDCSVVVCYGYPIKSFGKENIDDLREEEYFYSDQDTCSGTENNFYIVYKILSDISVESCDLGGTYDIFNKKDAKKGEEMINAIKVIYPTLDIGSIKLAVIVTYI
jgi:hypothetical protein